MRSFWTRFLHWLAILGGSLGLLASLASAHPRGLPESFPPSVGAQSGDYFQSNTTPSLSLRALPLVGGQPDHLRQRFKTANEAYTQGRYEQAVHDYRAILDAGYASVGLYHNLGNAYVRLGRTGLAVWAYERGRQLRPDDPRLRHNLEYVRRRAGLPLVGLPPRGLAALVAGWSPLLLYVGGILLLSGGLVGAVIWVGETWGGTWRRPMAWGPTAAGLLLVVGALGTSYVQAHDRRAVVTTQSVPLRPSPTSSAAADSTLKAGTMVDLQMAQSQWRRVRLGDGTVGWCSATALSEI
ncbi:MAG: SH3 domain-containing protein [Salinibacter sp.]